MEISKDESNPPDDTSRSNERKITSLISGGNLDSTRTKVRVGTENDVGQENDDETTSSQSSADDRTGDSEGVTEDSDSTTEGYDESSEQEYQSNVASIQTANQKRYLYTVWGSWSACTRTCGQRAYAFRKRYCINAVTGAIKRHCQRPTILAKKCALSPCPGLCFMLCYFPPQKNVSVLSAKHLSS